MNVFLGPVMHPEDLLALSAVLLGELLIIEIMYQTNDTPLFLIFSPLSGTIAHHPFHREGMFNEALILVVFCKELKGFFSGWNFRAHFKTS
jgi:hypothetical protein